MTRDELRAIIRGPIAAVPTPMGQDFQIDHAAMADLVDWWIENGIAGDTTVLKVGSAVGEGPDLTDDEWPRLLETVVDAAGARVGVVCGLKPKDTLHTIEDAKRAQALGAIGVQIDLPFFHHPTQDDIVRHFTDISDAIDIGILIYNTWWFGAPSISVDSMLRLEAAEHVVAIKWGVPPGEDYDQMVRFAHAVNVIDNELQPVRCHRNGGRGYISQTIPAYPQHDLEMWSLLEQRRYDEAQAHWDRVAGALRGFAERSGARSGGYREIKAMMGIMGHPVGPPRRPTLPLDDDEIQDLSAILSSLGWPVAGEGPLA